MLSKQLKVNCSDNNNNIEINTTEFFKKNQNRPIKKFTRNQVNLMATTLISILLNFYEEGLQREIILHRMQEIIL